MVVGLALTTGPALAAHHEPVMQATTVKVEPGKLDAYRAEVKKLQGVLARHGSKVAIRMWSILVGVGGATGGTHIVSLQFADQATWAADMDKAQSDPEWQKIMANVAGLRTLVSSGMWRDISPSPATSAAKPGRILLLTGVTVQPGKLADYLAHIARGQPIANRLGTGGNSPVAVWHAEIAGPATGGISVGVEYPDLASYVANQAKLTGDAEWQKHVAGFDAVRTVTGRWLLTAVPL
jgi:uncharacterized protein YbaA (DUF1428 family)